MSVTDDIKSRLDIVDIVSEHVPLRKSGTSLTGFCPFHTNTRTPAFVVFPNTQTWRCFGACAEGGDVFSFVMKKEGWEFKEALSVLAKRAGVELKPLNQAQKKQQAIEDKLGDILVAAADYYHQLLLHAPQAEEVRHYVSERGLSEETLDTFKIGYSLNSWDACRHHFSSQGYDDEDLIDAGLLTHNEQKGTRYDRFRNRLMIPIRAVNGHTVGFGARTLDPDGVPKYLNSPQTPVFDKSRLLFGLDLNRRDIRHLRQAVIVEGYMDVMQAWQAGFRNVVAQMGTALTESQLGLLKRYSKRFVLALDSDAAGAQATLRSLQVARNVLERESDVRFDARGLVRHEGRLKADIRIVSLPEGSDPDQIIRNNPELWPEMIEQAKPVVAYVIDVATEDLDLNDPKAKTAVVQQVLPLIEDVVDPIEREHYRQLLARRLKLDERILHQVAIPVRQKRERPRKAFSMAEAPEERSEISDLSAILRGSYDASEMRKADFLRQCMTYPQIIMLVNKKLAQNQQEIVSVGDFSRPDDRVLWHRLYQLQRRWTVVTEGEVWDSLDDELLRERIQTLLDLPKTPEKELERLPDRLVISILDWRLVRVRSLINEVEQLFHEAKAQNSPDATDMYSRQLRELPLQVLSINKARAAISMTSRRNSEQSRRSTPRAAKTNDS